MQEQESTQGTASTDTVPDLFTGAFSIVEALAQLRKRLLDLTARNRLLNFKPSKTKSLQLVDVVPNAVYDRLLKSQTCTFRPIPDPKPVEYVLQENRRVKPDVREYARQIGVSTTYELPLRPHRALTHGREGQHLQALFYPEELERQCRRISREAKSAIEETGTNMLYLVIGFIEFYESDDSERALNAPLVAIPVSLKRGAIDSGTRLYRYDLTYTGEEITENLSLREKLKQDFGIQMPEIKEDESPDDYFERVDDVISRKSRWKVKRQMTLALLSFAKMMLVKDIDPENWPVDTEENSLTEHPIVRQIFEGRSAGGNGGADGDYDIDAHKENDLELIYDADTSQHSALIDALAGKSLVVNGPPGTGKSQTITNLIAAAMARGMKVLFVSEKLAALEVVKHRLDLAGLGDFCLELHSHKTDKKRVVDELDKRKSGRYPAPRSLVENLEKVEQRRKWLKRYADIMNSKLGNELDLTVFDVLWRAERHRQDAGPDAAKLENVVLKDAPRFCDAQLDEMQRAVDDIARHYAEIGSFGHGHPWHGFFPESLSSGNDLAIQTLLVELIEGTKRLDEAMVTLREAAQERIAISVQIEEFARSIDGLKAPAPHVIPALLPRFFTPDDLKGESSKNTIEELKYLCDTAATLELAWKDKLLQPEAINSDTLASVKDAIQSLRNWKFSKHSLDELSNTATALRAIANGMQGTLAFFSEAAVLAGLPFDGTDAALLRLHEITGIAHAAPQELMAFRHAALNQPLAKEVLTKARNLLSQVEQQQQALDNIFWLDEEPSHDDLQQAIHTLRQGDAWYRFLQSDWRSACRIYKILARNKKAKKSGDDRLGELTALANYLKSSKEFQGSREYAEIFGRLFQGTNTDFDKVARLVDWYAVGSESLLRAGIPPAEFDPTLFDAFKLTQLALRFDEEQVHHKIITEAAEQVRVLLHNTDACLAARKSEESWPTRLHVLATFLDEFEAKIAPLKVLGHDNLTPEKLLQAMVARCEHITALEKIRSNQVAQQLLGEYFAERDTDFTGILETFAWGQFVIRANLPETTSRHLLSAEAGERLAALKQASAAAVSAIGCIKQFADDVNQYGAFNWSKWNYLLAPHTTEDPTEAMRARAISAIDNMDKLLPWTQYNASRSAAHKLGLKPFTEKLEADEVSSEVLVNVFLYRFHASIAQSIFTTTPVMKNFSTASHERMREQFAELDKGVIKLRGSACAADTARAARPPDGVSSIRVDERTEMELLNHLATLQRPRTSIRQMIRRAGRAIQEIKPCFMMGPLSVAQYLAPGAVQFDLVVMDEASQLKPEEALGAIARGKQLIVVGDPKQLPPTSFFDKMMTADDEEDEGTTLTTSESILDICMSLFATRTLRWHYRSKHESLIAFSNYHFYDGKLIVFPSPYPKNKLLGLRYHLIRDGIYQSRQNVPEAMRVVDAVLEHMRNRPDESLGVVTLNITQRDLIEEILETRLKDFDEGEAYKAKWENEGWPFFVKNLENVQGDERDVIYISTTFGKAPGTTVVRQNFGPISRPTGWRRLNVLFTRARKSLHVYSSMQPEDIVIDANTPGGTKALRNYLEYALSGILVGADITEREPDSDFEVSVADALRNKGFSVQPQLGVAGFFIDLVVRNPDRPGEFMAAIECDGATYHSGVSVRDRDRIRQEILESLGWKGKIWRIWSADWFRNPTNEIRRLLAFLESRRALAATEPAVYIEDPQVVAEKAIRYAIAEPQLNLEIQLVDEDEALFAEVGDTVTYCDVSEPEKRLQVLITGGQSNFDQGIINEATPLAKTLLDTSEGEETYLTLPGKEPRTFKVLKIERNGKTAGN